MEVKLIFDKLFKMLDRANNDIFTNQNEHRDILNLFHDVF